MHRNKREEWWLEVENEQCEQAARVAIVVGGSHPVAAERFHYQNRCVLRDDLISESELLSRLVDGSFLSFLPGIRP